MAGLDAARHEALIEGARRLHAAPNLEALRQVLLEVLTAVVRCDHAAYNELDAETGQAFTLFDRPDHQESFIGLLPAFEAHMGEHPLLDHFLVNPEAPPQRLSDFLSRPQLHDLGLYHEVYRHVDTEFQAVVQLSVPRRAVVGIALNRQASDFGDDDMAALALLYPHARQAYARCRRRALLDALLQGREDDALMAQLAAFGLSGREAEICFWIVQGKSNAEIGALLGISPLTAKKHSENVFRKLGAGGRVDVIRNVVGRLVALG